MEYITSEKKWIVVYTRSKWEKKVDQLLKEKEILSFCPLVKTMRQWADRRKEVEIPLFNSYVFVQVNQKEQMAVRMTPGVANFVYHCGKPAEIRASEIERIRSLVMECDEIEAIPIQKLSVGDMVKVKDGPLVNCHGEVVQIQGKSVMMVIDVLNCALLAKVKAWQTELV